MSHIAPKLDPQALVAVDPAPVGAGQDEPESEAADRFPRIILRRYGDDIGLTAVLAVSFVVFTLVAPFFTTLGNLENLLTSVAVIGTMAAVSTMVLVAGFLDLSVGSTAALSSALTAWLIARHGWPAGVAVGAGLASGVAVGTINGAISVAFDIDPIIVTIGSLSVFSGLAYVVTSGTEILVSNNFLLSLGSQQVLGLTWGVWIMLVAFVLVALTARYTIVGRNLHAVGANPRASLLSGLPIGRYRIGVLAASGLSAAVAGLVLAGESGTASATAATGYELQVITAVLLGGTSLLGGTGRIRGTLIAVLIIGVLDNGLTLLQVPGYWQTFAGGALLLIAVAVDRMRSRTRERRAAR